MIANMSGTKCPKCEKTSLELVVDFPSKAAFKMQYIRCSHCKTFLQALPFLHTNTLIEKLQEDIDKLKKKMSIYS